jgi:hypothetical protein
MNRTRYVVVAANTNAYIIHAYSASGALRTFHQSYANVEVSSVHEVFGERFDNYGPQLVEGKVRKGGVNPPYTGGPRPPRPGGSNGTIRRPQ